MPRPRILECVECDWLGLLKVACHTPFVSFSLLGLQPLLKLVMHSNLQAHQRRSTSLVREAALCYDSKVSVIQVWSAKPREAALCRTRKCTLVGAQGRTNDKMWLLLVSTGSGAMERLVSIVLCSAMTGEHTTVL